MGSSGHVGCVVGRRFGKLLVVEENRVPRTDKFAGRRLALKLICRCDCGFVKSYFKSNVLGGKSTKCSRCSGSNIGIGEKYDRLLVLKRAEGDGDDQRNFLCKCDCGGQCVCKPLYLWKGKSPRQCPKCRYPKKYSPNQPISRAEFAEINGARKHTKKKNEIIGQKSGLLKILGFSHWEYLTTRRRPWYFVKCKCGITKNIRGDWVGKVLSCGCARQHLKNGDHPRALLSNDEAKMIREMIESGIYLQKEIAIMFNIGEHLVSKIKLNKAYTE